MERMKRYTTKLLRPRQAHGGSPKSPQGLNSSLDTVPLGIPDLLSLKLIVLSYVVDVGVYMSI